MLAGIVALAGGYCALLAADGVVLLYCGAAAVGVFYGSFVALFPALVAELFGLLHAGTIGGFIVGFGGLLGAWGPAITGYLRDVDGDYGRGFALCLAAALATFAAFAVLRRPAPSASVA